MGRYRSIQSTLIEAALKGITDNQTVTAYKKDCKLFAVYCKAQGVKRPDQLQGKEKELLQGYEKELEASEYSPATIHRRLAAPCKATGINMNEIEKPKRTAGKIVRSRNREANKQGKIEATEARYNRLICLQKAVGIRRAELSRLTGTDLTEDESGYLCVNVSRGKGGKRQLAGKTADVLCEGEEKPLASEIIADQQEEIENLKAEVQKFKTENPDKIDRHKEDLFIRFQDCMEKLQYMLNSTIENYDFEQGAITDRDEAIMFGYNRRNICTEIEIARDYIVDIEEIRKELESLA